LTQGGIVSPLGLPLGEETGAPDARRQEFEGGTLDYADGGTDVTFTERPRTPAISVTPATPLPGSRVHVAVSGFADRTSLRISATGQQDFQVDTINGSYSWDFLVSEAAAPGTITLRAVDPATNASATATYTIRTLAQ